MAPGSAGSDGPEMAADPNPKPPRWTRPVEQLPPALWTRRQLAAYLNVHPKTLTKIIREQRPPCLRVGARLRFPPVEVRRWADAWKEGSR